MARSPSRAQRRAMAPRPPQKQDGPTNAELAEMILELKRQNEALRQAQAQPVQADPVSELQRQVRALEDEMHVHEVKSSMDGPCQMIVDGKLCGYDRFAHIPEDMGVPPLVRGHSYHAKPFQPGPGSRPGYYGRES